MQSWLDLLLQLPLAQLTLTLKSEEMALNRHTFQRTFQRGAYRTFPPPPAPASTATWWKILGSTVLSGLAMAGVTTAGEAAPSVTVVAALVGAAGGGMVAQQCCKETQITVYS